MTIPVIEVEGLRKSYGETVAVADLSFAVEAGEIFGLLGPNGAGKTTTMECVEGVRRPDAGRVTVLGMDPQTAGVALQNRIGVQLQQAELHKRIKVGEALALWTALYPQTVDGDRLLAELGLDAKRDAWFMTLSGGQKQRLFIALALINDPEVVFLDELTTGLDPQARRRIWALVRGIKERCKTVFLTTHLMEEAEQLCDRVAIVEHGRIIEMGSPAALVSRHCPERSVAFTCGREVDRAVFEQVAGVAEVVVNSDTVSLTGTGEDFVSEVIACLAAHQIRVGTFRTEQSTLEDVFLKLTGQSIRD